MTRTHRPELAQRGRMAHRFCSMGLGISRDIDCASDGPGHFKGYLRQRRAEQEQRIGLSLALCLSRFIPKIAHDPALVGQEASTNIRTAIASRVRWRNLIGDHSFPWGARHVGRPDLDVPSPPARRDACALIGRSFVFSSADTTTARQDRPETGPGCLGSTARSLDDRAAFYLSLEASDGSRRLMMCSVMPWAISRSPIMIRLAPNLLR